MGQKIKTGNIGAGAIVNIGDVTQSGLQEVKDNM